MSKKIKKETGPKVGVETKLVSRVHIRRCHICNQVTESEGNTVNQCDHCGKHMAPFYFFNESDVPPFSDFELRPIKPDGHRIPIRGFTAFW